MNLNHQDVINLLAAIGIMLIVGRFIGEIVRKIGFPMVVGELLAGIVLGPTILGHIHPEGFEIVFKAGSKIGVIIDAFAKIAVVLLLFIAGLEVELGVVLRNGRKAFSISSLSIVIPFFIGFITPWYFPTVFGVQEEQKLLFSLFLGTALSITALPVLARILMDLNLLKTDIGLIIIATAMIDDFMGWLFFSALLSMLNNNITVTELVSTIGFTLLFSVLMLSVGTSFFNKVLPWVNTKLAWPGGIISLSIAFCLLSAAFTEHIGIHAIFGSFIFGISIGQSEFFTEKTKEILYHFVNNIFAPLFFVSIGFKVDFLTHLDLQLTLIVIFIAYFGKIAGGWIGGRLAGFTGFKSLAIASCLNARGAMEIILGMLALEAGIINEKLFVALVIMAIVTSISAGPLAKLFLSKKWISK